MRNLAAIGIGPNDVDVVIISHFHGDHVSGLVAPDGGPAFPRAEITVPANEWSFWMDDDEREPRDARPDAVALRAQPPGLRPARRARAAPTPGTRRWCRA